MKRFRSRSLVLRSLAADNDVTEDAASVPLKSGRRVGGGGGGGGGSGSGMGSHGIDWASLGVTYLITLIAEGARGLFMPTLLPYFKRHGGSPGELGAFIAAYSLGRLLSVVPLGLISDYLSFSSIFYVASLLQVFGHLLYILAPSLPLLYASRIIVGVGSSTHVLTRSHVTKAIPDHLRTQHFAYLAAIQYAGIVVLPIVGGLFTLFPTLSLNFFPPLDGTTYPAAFMFFVNLLAMFLVFMCYHEPVSITPAPAPLPVMKHPSESYGATVSVVPEGGPPKRANLIALFVCFLVNLALKGFSAGLETITVPFLIERFQLNVSSASASVSALGICGVATFFMLPYLALYYSDRCLVFRGLAVMCAASLALSIPSVTYHMGASLYIACIGVTWSVGLPVAQTAVLALFSKLLTGLPVGGFIGLFSVSGSLAPLFASVCATKLWSQYGEEAVFTGLLTTVGSSLIVVWFFYHKLE